MTLSTALQSQILTSLNNCLNALLNHLTIFFANPPPRELPTYLVTPSISALPGSSNPSTPVPGTPNQFEETPEWSFLPQHSSALAACKWGLSILEMLAKRASEFISWGEDTTDAIRIAMGGIRERIVRASLIAWRGGVLKHGIANVDAEQFYVLEDWVVDKSRGNGVTGWVSGCHGYQCQVIQGLEALVKYRSQKYLTHSSFGQSYDSGRRIVGNIRGGVMAECKKEFETGIFTILETSIKLAKGSVESPVTDVQVEHVFPRKSRLMVGCPLIIVHKQLGRIEGECNSENGQLI